MKIKCNKCNKKVKPKCNRHYKFQLVLLSFGIPTVGLTWLILVFYRMFKSKHVCPECGHGIYK